MNLMELGYGMQYQQQQQQQTQRWIENYVVIVLRTRNMVELVAAQQTATTTTMYPDKR